MKKVWLIVAAVTMTIVAVAVLSRQGMAPDKATIPPAAEDTAETSTAGQDSTAAPADGQTVSKVSIKGFAFAPARLTVKKGTTVTWTNQDEAKHNATADKDSPPGGPSGPLLAKGQSYSFTFNTPGTFNYLCEPHPYMKGVVEVTP